MRHSRVPSIDPYLNCEKNTLKREVIELQKKIDERGCYNDENTSVAIQYEGEQITSSNNQTMKYKTAKLQPEEVNARPEKRKATQSSHSKKVRLWKDQTTPTAGLDQK